MKMNEQHMNIDEMIDRIISQSPPSVLVKCLNKNTDILTYINIDNILPEYEIVEPREYKVYVSSKNCEVSYYEN